MPKDKNDPNNYPNLNATSSRMKLAAALEADGIEIDMEKGDQKKKQTSTKSKIGLSKSKQLPEEVSLTDMSDM